MRFFTIIILFLSSVAIAKPGKSHDFNKVDFVKNYDGDTITVDIAGVHSLIGDEMKIRVRDINTPELKSKILCEKEIAYRAKQATWDLLQNKRITLEGCKRGTFFRLLCKVYADSVSLGDHLIEKGLAIKWEDRHGHVWCGVKNDL